MALMGCNGQSAGPSAKTAVRIGVYDSRMVAFAGSAPFGKWMTALRAEHDKARAAGDDTRVAELVAEADNRRKLMHKQGFSTAPVDDILKHITDRMSAIKAKASGTTAKVGGKVLTFYFPTAKESPAVTVEGGAAVVGNQRVTIKDGNLVLAVTG